ncbi:MAG TPA: LytTR family DNA-binding domain-containing protein [Rhizomicrobium sp.]|jgi:two-component system response regulator AlgR|nr:LytTR family DNA-binding domain-containing protein [Rhizomicrobium sp.]
MSEALRTLIVDDEPLAIERLQLLCAGIPGIAVAGTAAEGGSALRLIESLKPDLLLLDIQMPGMDGMALAKTLAGRENHPAVIFITAFDRFAVAAFDVAAVDYLLKPVEAERLERAVSRIRKEIAAQPAPLGVSRFTREFWVPHRSGIVRIAARDIDLIEAERDYMRLHVGPRSYLLHETITELERQLDPGEFVRLHRSTLVRRDRIIGFRHNGQGAWEAELADGRWLRVGRTYLANARAMANASDKSAKR